MIFCELTREEYNAFQKGHKYKHFLNDIMTLDLENLQGYTCQLVGVKEGNEILAATLLIRFPIVRGKFHFYYAPRGFLVDYDNEDLFHFFTKELKKYAKKKKALYVLVDPYLQYQERDADGNLVEGGYNHHHFIQLMGQNGYEHQGFELGFGKNFQDFRWTYVMPLEGLDKDILWKNLHQQTRWSINRTLKYQIQVKELNVDELSVFDDIMKDTAKRRNFPARDISFYQNQVKAYQKHLKVVLAYLDTNIYRDSLIRELNHEEEELKFVENELKKVPGSKKYTKKLKVEKEAIDLYHKKIDEVNKLEAEYGTFIPLAASEFINYGDEIIYLISGAYEEFRNFYASYAIQWYMIQKAIDEGKSFYNFYGITGNFDENSVDYGVYSFKRGFPGYCEELVGDFVLPVRSTIYGLLNLVKKCLKK